MRFPVLFLVASFLVACNGGSSDGPLRPDLGGGTDSGGSTDSGGAPDAGTDFGMSAPDLGAVQELSGTVMTDQCGNFHVGAAIDIPVGSVVTICAGAHLTFDVGVGLRVRGTLHVPGTAVSHVTFDGTTGWTGLSNSGSMDASFIDVSGASIGLSTLSGATTMVTDSTITAPNASARTINIGGGATIDRTVMRGGNTNEINGGMLNMTDSTIDLMRDPRGLDIDCTHNDGGGMTLDHVLITNCHCPLHFNSTNMPVMVTNSVLGGAGAVSIMIAGTNAEIHHNALLAGLGVDDITLGGSSTVVANVSGNFWQGGTPTIATVSGDMITGQTDVLTSMPTDVGPR